MARLNGRGPRSLHAMAAAAHRSQWDFHRLFRAVAGEPPAGFARRVALDRAAARLVTDADVSVLTLALEAGFHSHEGFTRAFTRRFDVPPTVYRSRGLAGGPTAEQARDHRRIVEATSPCLHVYRLGDPKEDVSMTVEVHVEEVPGFSALVARRRIPRDAVADTLGECLPSVFGHAQRSGLTITSPPFTRYPEVGHGTFVIECGFAIADASSVDVVDGMTLIEVAPGRAATATHRGPYDRLPETYAAIEQWLSDHAMKAGGPAWETYITDPGHHPDPADWVTEVTQPIAE